MDQMDEIINKYVLNNGLVILGEPMAKVASAAFNFMLPAGAARLPQDCCGASAVIENWIFRGTKRKTSRDLTDKLDGLGLHRNSAVGSAYLTLGAALEGSNLAKALELYTEIILEPMLNEDQFELSCQLALQDLLSLDDDPRQKVMLKLRQQFYPEPLGNPPSGTTEDLEALTATKAANLVNEHFDIGRAIFSVAGKYDFEAVCEQLETHFSGEQQKQMKKIVPGEKGALYSHEHHDGAQVHIGLMTATVPVNNDDYYNAMAAVSVLSGGMSARLFTEVREKRGLCYAVGANYHTLKEMAGICCYAGTTPEKAQETVDVIIAEFNKLAEGISEEEIQRAKVGLKSTLIMQSESSSARAGAAGADYYLLGRVRKLEEIKQKIEEINVDSVINFLKSNPFGEYTVVTIGPKEIEVKI
jgi:predicted Zn-dependent peptidase